MKFTRNQIIIIAGIGIFVLLLVLMLLGVIPGLKGSGDVFNFQTGRQAELKFWGVFDDVSVIQPVISEYSQINKDVRIDYRHFDDATVYEKELVNALATGKAPDILMFHNTWLLKHYDKILPAPENTFSLSQLQQLFPTIVEQDFALDGKVYSLPLYVDTLALLYNKDIFDAKAIALTPSNWNEFQTLIPQLRLINQLNQIIKPAVAIGGSEKSINYASDLLNLLMMQFDNQMINIRNSVNFGTKTLGAFDFYLQFANPSSPYYTWNDNLLYSIDSFAQGSTAIIFNYASQIPLIKDKSPFLNLGISAMPQLVDAAQGQPVNYANYWGLAVSNQSKNSLSAWNFIVSVTTNPKIAEIYLKASNKPPALRSLIEKYKNDPQLGVFAKQALSARSWPQPDNTEVKQFFSDMIESVLNGRLSAKNALTQAENEINDLFRAKR